MTRRKLRRLRRAFNAACRAEPHYRLTHADGRVAWRRVHGWCLRFCVAVHNGRQWYRFAPSEPWPAHDDVRYHRYVEPDNESDDAADATEKPDA